MTGVSRIDDNLLEGVSKGLRLSDRYIASPMPFGLTADKGPTLLEFGS